MNAFFFNHIMELGGTESFLYYLAKKYKDRSITVYYRTGDAGKLTELQKYVEVKRYNDERIKCKKAFFNYTLEAIDNVDAEEYIFMVHADYMIQGGHLTLHPKINRYIAVSESAAKSFEKFTGKKCEVCYNPIDINTECPLILMSATRLSPEKGKERMQKLANALDIAAVDYRWFVFTNDRHEPIKNKNVIYLPADKKITALMKRINPDVFIQLSDCETYCYSVVEANTLGIPCVYTDLPVFKELGIKGVAVDLELKEIPIDKIVKLKKVKFTPPADRWGEILTSEQSTYKPPKDKVQIVKAKKKYFDIFTGLTYKPNEQLTVSVERAKDLKDKGLVW